MTVHVSICRLRRAAHYMAPDCNLAWLAEIGKDLAFEVRPRPKFHRLVTCEVLVEAGLTLIQEAEASANLSELAQASHVRNGLMVVLLALCPVRLKNFTALEIGRNFQKIRSKWWILLTASETKENRADERPVDELITPIIDRYLDQHRPVLARTDKPPPALWLSSRSGKPMKGGSVRDLISSTTLATVGVDVSPHLFRTCAASTAAILGGENPHLGSALLHHTNSRVTNIHYNRAGSLSAAESFRQIVRQYEKK
jgi:integrase